LCVNAAFSEALMLFEFELLEASAHWEAFVPDADSASCEALDDAALVA